DLVRLLLEAVQATFVPDRHRILPTRKIQQDGIEHVLRATLAPLGTAHRRFFLAARGKGLPAELIAGHARAPYAVLPVVERIGCVAYCVEKPQRRQNSMVRTPTVSILGWTIAPSDCSMSSVLTPRLPRSPARLRPTGPPPTIRTSAARRAVMRARSSQITP